MQIRDRIKELRRVPVSKLRPHPRNWRTHPDAQRDALRGVLAEVGYADALLARELADGSLQLIDGHLRAETTPEAVVPVLVLDVDEAEADKILLTHDPLAAMAAVVRRAASCMAWHPLRASVAAGVATAPVAEKARAALAVAALKPSGISPADRLPRPLSRAAPESATPRRRSRWGAAT